MEKQERKKQTIFLYSLLKKKLYFFIVFDDKYQR